MLSQERASTFRLGLHEKRTEQNINRKRTFKKQTEMSASAQFILVLLPLLKVSSNAWVPKPVGKNA